jgi:hypothetical protein
VNSTPEKQPAFVGMYHNAQSNTNVDVGFIMHLLFYMHAANLRLVELRAAGNHLGVPYVQLFGHW